MALDMNEASSLLREIFLPKLIDSVFTSNLLLQKLYDNREYLDGGETFSIPLIYASDQEGEGGFYDDTVETLPLEQKEGINSMRGTWTSLVQPIAITNRELAKFGSSEAAAISLLRARTERAYMAMKERIQKAIFMPAGTGPFGLLTLEDIFDQNNTYLGIDRSTNPWWRAKEISNSGTLGTAAALDLRRLQEAVLEVTEDEIGPSIMITTKQVFAKYWSSLQAQERYRSLEGQAGGGTQVLLFNDIPMYAMSKCPHDGLDGNSKERHKIYILNLNYLKLVVVRNWDMQFVPFQRVPGTQKWVAEIHLFFQIVCTNPRYQAVFRDVDPTA